MGVGHSQTEEILVESGSIPLAENTWPRYLTWHTPMLHLPPRRVSPADWSLSKTTLRWLSCSSVLGECIRTSSRYVVTNDRYHRIVSIKRWNEAGASDRPKGILQNWKSPRPGPGQNAVLAWSLGFTGSCQYPLWRSRVEKTTNPASQSCTSSGWGSR